MLQQPLYPVFRALVLLLPKGFINALLQVTCSTQKPSTDSAMSSALLELVTCLFLGTYKYVAAAGCMVL